MRFLFYLYLTVGNVRLYGMSILFKRVDIYLLFQNATMGISQMVPNIQNFAEAAGCGSFVFDIIERVSQGLCTFMK